MRKLITIACVPCLGAAASAAVCAAAQERQRRRLRVNAEGVKIISAQKEGPMRRFIALATGLCASAAIIPAIAGAGQPVGLRGVTPALQARADLKVRQADSQGKASVEKLLHSIRTSRPYGVALAKAFLSNATKQSSPGGVRAASPAAKNGCWYVSFGSRAYERWTDGGVVIGYINKWHQATYCGYHDVFLNFGSSHPLTFSGEHGTHDPFCFKNWHGLPHNRGYYAARGYWADSWNSANLGFYEGRTCIYDGYLTKAQLNVSAWGTFTYTGTL